MGPFCPSVCANFCSAVRQSRTISPSTITVDFLPYPALPYPTLPYPASPSVEPTLTMSFTLIVVAGLITSTESILANLQSDYPSVHRPEQSVVVRANRAASHQDIRRALL